MQRARRHTHTGNNSSRVEHLIETLSLRGYRVTRARRAIITFLSKASTNLSIDEIVRGAGVDQATVYRTMALLESEQLVTVLRTPIGQDTYELPDSHHDHAVCTGCGVIAHIPCQASRSEKIRVPTLRTVTGHSILFYGLCRTCE